MRRRCRRPASISCSTAASSSTSRGSSDATPSARWRRLAKPGGHVVIVVPNASHPTRSPLGLARRSTHDRPCAVRSRRARGDGRGPRRGSGGRCLRPRRTCGIDPWRTLELYPSWLPLRALARARRRNDPFHDATRRHLATRLVAVGRRRWIDCITLIRYISNHGDHRLPPSHLLQGARRRASRLPDRGPARSRAPQRGESSRRSSTSPSRPSRTTSRCSSRRDSCPGGPTGTTTSTRSTTTLEAKQKALLATPRSRPSRRGGGRRGPTAQGAAFVHRTRRSTEATAGAAQEVPRWCCATRSAGSSAAASGPRARSTDPSAVSPMTSRASGAGSSTPD